MLQRMANKKRDSADLNSGRRSPYVRPISVETIPLQRLLAYTGRPFPETQINLFREQDDADLEVYYSGDLSLLLRKCVSVIGARDVSPDGQARAKRVAKELSDFGIVVTSGLAKGVDIAAHRGAIDAGGKTIAVIGTPIEKAYPIEHAETQMEIYTDHLLISQFRPGQRTFPSDFPKRNRLMAALTDASVIVEASDTSGTLHQAVECTKLGRWLFIANSVVEDPRLSWPKKFLEYENCVPLKNISDITTRLL
ncbi:DNA-processing protein DprA [Mesorhizobium sp. ISC11]|uniref:DNA-processing protein DprA n=1 Tax=Mesorhizobium sp. ISC11 TaxID=3076428 RepID=UPI00301DBA75